MGRLRLLGVALEIELLVVAALAASHVETGVMAAAVYSLLTPRRLADEEAKASWYDPS